MKRLVDGLLAEPNLILGVVRAGLAMAVGFGIGWTGEQVALTVVFSEALFTAISRALSTSTSAPVVAAGTTVSVTTPAGQADYEVDV